MTTQVSGFSQAFHTRINTWLSEQGWKVGEEHAPDVNWILVISDKQDRKVAIIQPSDNRDEIVIGTELNIGNSLQQQISKLADRDRRNVIFDLRQALILLEVQSSGVGLPLTKIELSIPSYFDGLTKDEFLRRVSRIRHGLSLVMDIISKALDHPPPPEPEDEKRRIAFSTP